MNEHHGMPAAPAPEPDVRGALEALRTILAGRDAALAVMDRELARMIRAQFVLNARRDFAEIERIAWASDAELVAEWRAAREPPPDNQAPDTTAPAV